MIYDRFSPNQIFPKLANPNFSLFDLCNRSNIYYAKQWRIQNEGQRQAYGVKIQNAF